MTEPTTAAYVPLVETLGSAFDALLVREGAISSSPLDPKIRELIKVRASQITRCAYCVDMHYKDARAAGETEERLYMLPAWREAGVYTATERAALALTEAL